MKRTSASLALTAAFAALILSGCVISETTVVRDRRPVYGPPGPPPPGPVVVEEPAYVVIHRPPPEVIVERIPARPGPEFIWIQGYYAARGEEWIWVPGHYERPPRPGAVWVPPRYDNRGTEVHFSVGVWR